MVLLDQLAYARAIKKCNMQKKKVGRGIIKTTKEEKCACPPAPTPPERPAALRSAAAAEAPVSMGNFPRIDDNRMPGGSRDCGGGLHFPRLRLACGKRPFFPMPPGALSIFRGLEFRHETCEHGPLAARAEGHQAHVSFAVQTPFDVLDVKGERRAAVHRSLVEHGALDACELWLDAVWLPVTVEVDQEEGGRPSGAEGQGSASTRSSRARQYEDKSRRHGIRTCDSPPTRHPWISRSRPTVCREKLL